MLLSSVSLLKQNEDQLFILICLKNASKSFDLSCLIHHYYMFMFDRLQMISTPKIVPNFPQLLHHFYCFSKQNKTKKNTRKENKQLRKPLSAHHIVIWLCLMYAAKQHDVMNKKNKCFIGTRWWSSSLFSYFLSSQSREKRRSNDHRKVKHVVCLLLSIFLNSTQKNE